MAGLKEWFKQDWVDIGSKKKGGGFEKCGRKSASGSKRKYPKCVRKVLRVHQKHLTLNEQNKQRGNND